MKRIVVSEEDGSMDVAEGDISISQLHMEGIHLVQGGDEEADHVEDRRRFKKVAEKLGCHWHWMLGCRLVGK